MYNVTNSIHACSSKCLVSDSYLHTLAIFSVSLKSCVRLLLKCTFICTNQGSGEHCLDWDIVLMYLITIISGFLVPVAQCMVCTQLSEQRTWNFLIAC